VARGRGKMIQGKSVGVPHGPEETFERPILAALDTN